jgi:hypothetical protein
MASHHHNFCKFQKISHAAAYNLLNTRNPCSCLVFVDLRRTPQAPFPGAIIPPPGTPDGASDLSVLLSCLQNQLSGQQSAQSRIVLFIEERRIASIENDMAVRCRGRADAEPQVTTLDIRWQKFCCFDIDHLFQFVPSQFIAAAMMAGHSRRVPSLIECLLPRALFLCEQKLVPQALNPASGLGISCVFNVTTNPPAHSPGITLSFPIEDSVDCDIEAGALRERIFFLISLVVTLLRCCCCAIAYSFNSATLLQCATKRGHYCCSLWADTSACSSTAPPASAEAAAWSSTLSCMPSVSTTTPPRRSSAHLALKSHLTPPSSGS